MFLIQVSFISIKGHSTKAVNQKGFGLWCNPLDTQFLNFKRSQSCFQWYSHHTSGQCLINCFCDTLVSKFKSLIRKFNWKPERLKRKAKDTSIWATSDTEFAYVVTLKHIPCRNEIKHSHKERTVILQDVRSDPTLPRTKDVVCPECQNQEAVFFSASTEEGMTLFFNCTSCGHRWRDYVW